MASKGMIAIDLDTSPEDEINADNLQFQDIKLSASAKKPSTATGKGRSTEPEQVHVFTNFPNPDDSDGDDSTNKSNLLPESKKPTSSFWSFEYYQQFFDVDTYDVLRRLLGSFVPKPKTNFLTHQIRPNPDLYGPFWVCVTLIFTVAVAGNFASYIQHRETSYKWKYDFHKVTSSAAAIFVYWWLVPAVLWVLFWRRGSTSGISFLEMICIYGYSLTIYIPVSVLWVIQLTWLQWTLVVVAMCLSGTVLILTFWPALAEDSRQLAVLTSAVIFVLHGLLAVGFMLFFFYVPSSSSETPSSDMTSLPGDVTTINLLLPTAITKSTS